MDVRPESARPLLVSVFDDILDEIRLSYEIPAVDDIPRQFLFFQLFVYQVFALMKRSCNLYRRKYLRRKEILFV